MPRAKRKYLKFDNEVLLRDALNNWRPDSGASADYCRGLTVGVASAMCAIGLTLGQAIDAMVSNMPRITAARLSAVVPESWEADFRRALAERGIELLAAGADHSRAPQPIIWRP